MLVLDGLTAFDYWMCSYAPSEPNRIATTNALLTTFDHLTCREISRKLERQDGLPGELQLLVRNPGDRRRSDTVYCSSWGDRPLPPGSLTEIGDGICVISPELCAVRLARFLTRPSYVRALSDLLGRYSRDFDRRGDLAERSPLTSISRIRAYLDAAGSLPGSALTRMTLGWIVEGAASPRETTMDIALALPTKSGGQGIPRFEANCRIDLSSAASGLTQRSFLVGDAVWKDRKLVIEYNSSKHHDTPSQLEMDFEKITALQHMGYLVVPISTRQFSDFEVFKNIMVTVRRHLGVRDRYAESTHDKRLLMHRKLLKDETARREEPSLGETAPWQYLLPHLHDAMEIAVRR